VAKNGEAKKLASPFENALNQMMYYRNTLGKRVFIVAFAK